jgi:hypothetical protein
VHALVLHALHGGVSRLARYRLALDHVANLVWRRGRANTPILRVGPEVGE